MLLCFPPATPFFFPTFMIPDQLQNHLSLAVVLEEEIPWHANGNSVSITQPAIPIFKGECWSWSIKLKTLSKSEDLQDLVDNGYADKIDWRRTESRTLKAIFFFQQAVWDRLFKNCSGYNFKASLDNSTNWVPRLIKVMAVKLQTLQREFETLIWKIMSQSKTFCLEYCIC